VDVIEITDSLRIPESEIEYTFSRSSKPGGQKVNKTSTRVTLVFDLDRSASLSDDERRRIKRRLRTRITTDGLLRVVSQKHRSQHANREAARVRFTELLRWALKRERRRRKTAVPRDAIEQRLQEKKRRGLLKGSRSRISDLGD
jgi:ribosome-associated protein